MGSWWTPILYPVLTTMLYYLGWHAVITEPIWSRYPKDSWIEKWAKCPACSSVWYGAGVAAGFGYWQKWSFFALPPHHPVTWAVAGFWCAVLTVVLSYVMLRAVGAVVGPWEDIKAMVDRRAKELLNTPLAIGGAGDFAGPTPAPVDTNAATVAVHVSPSEGQ
jgi:hypothetical protein